MSRFLKRSVPRSPCLFGRIIRFSPCCCSRVHRRAWSSHDASDGLVLGILRENYDPWERRVPLCPNHVERLLQRFQTTRNTEPKRRVMLKDILVQPSTRRIYNDDEYARVGAKLQDDLSGADLILGVKRPRSTEHLYPNKAYFFFSHVIKGQTENMPLLQYILENRIQLFDYECIVDKKKRLVAFGKFAGMAGTTDTFQILGRRLLSKGFSTPLLNCPPAHMHHDWNEVKQSLKTMGEHIAEEGLSIEHPIVYCFTGKGGNVHGGALEAFELLPHKWVRVQDLSLLNRMPGPHHCVYGVTLGTEDVLRHRNRRTFDRAHYMKYPAEYESVFARHVAPYVTVLVNGMYWDERYPRILTKQQMHDLYARGEKSLMMVADISCDVNGSVEFLERKTTIDHPTFLYDPVLRKETVESNNSDGVTVLSVDILPTELPRESSLYFGDALLPVLDEFIELYHRDEGDILPESLKHARITKDGALTPKFRHLRAFVNRSAADEAPSRDADVVLHVKGHIFDSGLINQLLNALENNDCSFEIIECHVGQKIGDVHTQSTLVLHIAAKNERVLSFVGEKIENLTKAIEAADASIEYIDHKDGISLVEKSGSIEVIDLPKEEHLLILGAGKVSRSLASYIGRDPRRSIVVASIDIEESRSVANAAKNSKPVQLDVRAEGNRLADLIKNSDVVVSLLPAAMHGLVATKCVVQRTNLISASYESPDIRALDESARTAGIAILNEVGLDPGLDHMSAMRIIEKVHDRDGAVSYFSSVCGGLPAPGSANNPLKYKFSWSPMGVLAACQNDAMYRMDGHEIMVTGNNLLRAAKPFDRAWASLGLECLPNRNALMYGETYGVQDASTIFRGTLRYGGFSQIMSVLQKLGLFGSQAADCDTWIDLIPSLGAKIEPLSDTWGLVMQHSGGDVDVAEAVMQCLDFLGMTRASPLSNRDCIIESFCAALETACRYGDSEHDMVLMHHDIKAFFPDGTQEHHRSKLQLLGDSQLSAMAKTVGYTAGAATDLLLRSEPSKFCGSLRPIDKSIYEPILKAMESEGIAFSESVHTDDLDLSGQTFLP